MPHLCVGRTAMKIGSTELTASGTDDLFVCKLSPDNEVRWAVSGGGKGADRGTSVATDETGNIYISGALTASTELGNKDIDTFGETDVLVAQLSAPGFTYWIRGYGGEGADWGSSISVRGRRLFVSGVFEAVASFAERFRASFGGQDAFVAALTTSGASLWVRTAGGPGEDLGQALTTDIATNVYVATSLSDQAVINGTHQLPGLGERDILVWSLGFND